MTNIETLDWHSRIKKTQVFPLGGTWVLKLCSLGCYKAQAAMQLRVLGAPERKTEISRIWSMDALRLDFNWAEVLNEHLRMNILAPTLTKPHLGHIGPLLIGSFL